MTTSKRKRPEPINPEWTKEDFERARPASEVLPALVGNPAWEARRRGRPRVAHPKMMVSMRLDQDVIAALKATGPGWQSRVNAALRRWLEAGRHGKSQ
jgi:uncharacterized protein (DUF4415 family)